MFDVKKEFSHDKYNNIILSKHVLATPKLPLKPSYRLITARGYFKETIRPIVATLQPVAYCMWEELMPYINDRLHLDSIST